MIAIEFIENTAFSQSINLDGRSFIINMQYNNEYNVWHMSIYSSNEEPIVLNIALVAQTFLLKQYKDDRLPPGEFVVNAVLAPDFDDFFNGNAQLVYITEEELNS